MKKWTLFLPILCVAVCSYGQWQNTTGGIYYNGGKVGIGTPDPQDALHVNGDYTGKGHLMLYAYEGDGSSGTAYVQARDRSGTSSIDMQFRTQNNGNLVNAIRINANGNVGIGTTAPSTKLEVNGPIKLTNQQPIYFAGGPSDPNYLIRSGAWDDGMKYKHWTSHQFYTNGTEKMRILKNGYVGLGTSDPNARLEIGVVHSANQSDEMRIGSYWQGNFHGIGFNYQLNGSGTVSKHIVEHHGTNSYTAMTFRLGNVGIGTAFPDAKLTVKGDIHAEEVKVDLNVPGPDYVFDEDYNLRSLEDLQNYIRENKHLPEVPSAKEMEANGIDLGVMNLLLLKKVEELTLHLIQQSEINKAQAEEITVLKQLIQQR